MHYPSMTNATNLSPAMNKALALIAKEGFAYAGRTVTRDCMVISISAAALRGLERRGLVDISTNPDGGIMATLRA